MSSLVQTQYVDYLQTDTLLLIKVCIIEILICIDIITCTSGTPEQARPARPRSGLDFQIHKSRGYSVIILEALLLTIGLAWQKSVPASLYLLIFNKDSRPEQSTSTYYTGSLKKIKFQYVN